MTNSQNVKFSSSNVIHRPLFVKSKTAILKNHRKLAFRVGLQIDAITEKLYYREYFLKGSKELHS